MVGLRDNSERLRCWIGEHVRNLIYRGLVRRCERGRVPPLACRKCTDVIERLWRWWNYSGNQALSSFSSRAWERG